MRSFDKENISNGDGIKKFTNYKSSNTPQFKITPWQGPYYRKMCSVLGKWKYWMLSLMAPFVNQLIKRLHKCFHSSCSQRCFIMFLSQQLVTFCRSSMHPLYEHAQRTCLVKIVWSCWGNHWFILVLNGMWVPVLWVKIIPQPLSLALSHSRKYAVLRHQVH